jgi:hypothetical protein
VWTLFNETIEIAEEQVKIYILVFFLPNFLKIYYRSHDGLFDMLVSYKRLHYPRL